MGFDPRRWRPPSGSRPVTANLDSVLAENEALRREVRQLREQLARFQAAAGPAPGPRTPMSQGTAPSVSAADVQRWIQAMARHPAWQGIRIGPPGGLRGLADHLRARSWNPELSLEEELNRRQSGLGSDLQAALRGPHSRGRWAVRAAFALYGPAAIEWLSAEPGRVVAELLRLMERLETTASQQTPPGAGRGASRAGPRRGTRTANTSWASGDQEGARRPATPPASGSEAEALAILGLEPGASRALIKRTYRQLAKLHHPDLGGDAAAFQRLDAAYRLLIGS